MGLISDTAALRNVELIDYAFSPEDLEQAEGRLVDPYEAALARDLNDGLPNQTRTMDGAEHEQHRRARLRA
jgi:hypothetical protein